jgi:branched-subunit amino acid ABC-type transport system permease component
MGEADLRSAPASLVGIRWTRIVLRAEFVAACTASLGGIVWPPAEGR